MICIMTDSTKIRKCYLPSAIKHCGQIYNCNEFHFHQVNETTMVAFSQTNIILLYKMLALHCSAVDKSLLQFILTVCSTHVALRQNKLKLINHIDCFIIRIFQVSMTDVYGNRHLNATK